MSNPRILLIDELSLGLSPAIVKRIYSVVPRVIESGCAVLFVEQDVSQALSVADHALCLLEGARCSLVLLVNSSFPRSRQLTLAP